jgi:hypothetical protein
MPKGMKRRDIETALRNNGCKPVPNSGRGDHEKWGCPCGQHTANVPRHRDITPGVVGDIIRRLPCLPGGWLQ